jgi:valyl-tRNA synthetase
MNDFQVMLQRISASNPGLTIEEKEAVAISTFIPRIVFLVPGNNLPFFLHKNQVRYYPKTQETVILHNEGEIKARNDKDLQDAKDAYDQASAEMIRQIKEKQDLERSNAQKAALKTAEDERQAEITLACQKAAQMARLETIEAATIFAPELKITARNGMKQAGVELGAIETAKDGLRVREELARETIAAARQLLSK